MQLTKRQIDILAYLLSRKDWVTSEQLSIHFEMNRKTIQQEIKLITEALAGKGMIISSKSRGYYLEHLTEEMRFYIREEIMKYGGRNSLGLKPSSLVLYFLFLKTHITMQTLADTFYMSKTAISLELSTVKRWVDRWEGIELEVSNKSVGACIGD